MTDEKQLEIIKALAYGESVEAIAELEEITVEEVNGIAEDTESIEAKKDWLKESGCFE